MIRRRDFIAGLGGAAAWPLSAHAQQGNRMRRIGVLVAGDENDPWYKPRVSGFTQALADLGWTDGRNLRMDLRWFGDDTPLSGDFDQWPDGVEGIGHPREG
jgi:putative ABC transport system substrate-binding protein